MRCCYATFATFAVVVTSVLRQNSDEGGRVFERRERAGGAKNRIGLC